MVGLRLDRWGRRVAGLSNNALIHVSDVLTLVRGGLPNGGRFAGNGFNSLFLELMRLVSALLGGLIFFVFACDDHAVS